MTSPLYAYIKHCHL